MSEYIFVTNIFEYSNILIYSSHSGSNRGKRGGCPTRECPTGKCKMKVLPRLDIFKVRQLKGSPRTTQDTMEETGWDPKLGRILSKSWDKKGIFCGDFCAAAAKQQGTVAMGQTNDGC